MPFHPRRAILRERLGAGVQDDPTPCTETTSTFRSTTDKTAVKGEKTKTGIIIAGFTGIIIAGLTGIIIAGAVDDGGQETCGIIIAG